MKAKDSQICYQHTTVNQNNEIYIGYYKGFAVVTGVTLNQFGKLIWTADVTRVIYQKEKC